MLVSLTAYSQVGTVRTKDSSICLSKEVAKEVVKDLYRKDSLEAEMSLMASTFQLLADNSVIKDKIISNKDSIIFAYIEKEKYLNSISTYKDSQIVEYKTSAKEFSDKLNKSRKANSFWKATTLISVVTTITLALICL